MPMRRGMHSRFLKFLLVGLFNTAVGVALIAGGILVGLHPLVANALGFLVGLCISFLLNSRFTFNSGSRDVPMIARYLIAFLVAYGCNLVTVLALEQAFPRHVITTHVLGIVPYTIVFFLLADSFVFRTRQLHRADAQAQRRTGR